MKNSIEFLTILLLYVVNMNNVRSDSLSALECLDRGFLSDNLLCSNCHDLQQFKLNELENTCQQCCTHTDTEEEKGIVRNS